MAGGWDNPHFLAWSLFCSGSEVLGILALAMEGLSRKVAVGPKVMASGSSTLVGRMGFGRARIQIQMAVMSKLRGRI